MMWKTFSIFLFYIGVQFINNVLLVPGEGQSDSVIHIHLSILFQILFSIKLLSRVPCTIQLDILVIHFKYSSVYMLTPNSLRFLFKIMIKININARFTNQKLDSLSMWITFLYFVVGSFPLAYILIIFSFYYISEDIVHQLSISCTQKRTYPIATWKHWPKI